MKDEFEKKVKEQLEDRQLPVSGNAWNKLSQILEKEEKKRGRKLWIPLSIAASLVLLFGIVFINTDKVNSGFEEVKISNQTQIEEKLPVIIEDDIEENRSLIEYETVKPTPETVVYKSKEPVMLNQDLTQEVESKEQISAENFMVTVEDNPEELIAEVILQENIQNEPEIVINETSEPKEKVKYTNPNLLLYSVENNETLNQTKEGFRLVLIDFNK